MEFNHFLRSQEGLLLEKAGPITAGLTQQQVSLFSLILFLINIVNETI